MNLKKAIVATLVVAGMLTALAGPIPARADAAQVKQQADRWTVQVDPKFTEKLNKAVKIFAGKDVELQEVGKLGVYSAYICRSAICRWEIFCTI
ncbi:hypothetical protein ABU162_28225 [Paenibacillus thiaminolyticus]|uniref:hypothetical protein n=1 Tax=Paenibacillus thiaminolyticus TaxID=49283 RepID=UPI0035A5AC5D